MINELQVIRSAANEWQQQIETRRRSLKVLSESIKRITRGKYLIRWIDDEGIIVAGFTTEQIANHISSLISEKMNLDFTPTGAIEIAQIFVPQWGVTVPVNLWQPLIKPKGVGYPPSSPEKPIFWAAEERMQRVQFGARVRSQILEIIRASRRAHHKETMRSICEEMGIDFSKFRAALIGSCSPEFGREIVRALGMRDDLLPPCFNTFEPRGQREV